MNFGSGECIESSACVEAVLKHKISGDFILKKSAHAWNQFCILPKTEICGIVSYQHFPCHFAISMWVTSRSYVHGLHPGCFVGWSMGQQV